MKRKVLTCILACVLGISTLTACGSQEILESQDVVEPQVPKSEPGYGTGAKTDIEIEPESYDDVFTKRDLEQVADLDAAVYVNLSDGGTTIDGRGATVEGNTVTFTDEGVYVLTGSLQDGQLVIDAAKEDKIQLVLQGMSVTSDTSAALYVKQADKVFVTTGAGTDNSLMTSGEFIAIDDNNIDGAVFSKDDIVFNGEGALNIVCTTEHGIVGKDDIKITGGNITVDADGDGLQANDGIYIGDGNVYILNSYEGMQAQNISVWNGHITIIAEDDGINGAGGSDGSGAESFGGNNPFSADLSCNVAIHGGIVNISADGDGLDSNGNLLIEGGEVYVNGPTNSGNGAIDYGGNGIINGGILVAAGASGMAENMGMDSTQCTMMVTFGNDMISGEIVVKDDAGNVILSYIPEKRFNNAVISHPDLEVGKTYTVTASENTVEVTFESAIYGQGMMNGGGHGGGFGGHGGGKGQGGEREDFGGRGQRPGDMEMPEGMELPEGMTPPEMGERPEMPEGTPLPPGE